LTLCEEWKISEHSPDTDRRKGSQGNWVGIYQFISPHHGCG